MATITDSGLSAYELERGKPMPSYNHGKIQARLIVALARYADRYDTLSELSLSLTGEHFPPVITLYPNQPTDWHHDQIRVEKAPVLAVEILSPTQGFNSLVPKLDAYFAHGVKSCWIIQPGLKTLTVFHSPHESATYDRGMVRDDAVGVEVDLDALFA